MMEKHTTAPDNLEARLAAWGAAQALAPHRAEQLRTAILMEASLADAAPMETDVPPLEPAGPLSSEWWALLARNLCHTLAQAVEPRPRPVLPLPVLPG